MKSFSRSSVVRRNEYYDFTVMSRLSLGRATPRTEERREVLLLKGMCCKTILGIVRGKIDSPTALLAQPCGVELEIAAPASTEGVDGGIIPNSGPVAAMLSELNRI